MKQLLCAIAAFVLCFRLVCASELSLESAPPVVVKTSPTAGTVGIDPATSEIVVMFSKEMRAGSWSWSTYSKDTFPETPGEPKYADDKRTCVLPVKLEPGKFYAIWLNSDKFKNFKDTEGRPAVPYLLTFKTSGTSTPTDAKTPNRKFVRFVAGKDRLTFQGKPISRDDIDTVLKAIPDRSRTVVEVAGEADMPFSDFTQIQGIIGKAVQDLGFEYVSLVGTQPPNVTDASALKLNDDQRLVLDWTDRQFRSFFDARTFAGMAADERTAMETRLIDTLKGPQTREYYQAINTLAALQSTNALPALRTIALDRRDKDNRDRWMAIRALGIIGDRSSVPELIHLVYHGNVNTRWWAQISLARITGQNFGSDWQAWGKWWNESGGEPKFTPEVIQWWSGQAKPDQLAASLRESDQKFLDGIRAKAARN